MAGGYILCTLSFSLVEGSYNNIIRIFTEDQTGHIQVHKDDYLTRARIYKTIDDPKQVETVLDAHPQIRSYAPRIYAPALAYAGDNSAPAQVTGVDPVQEKATSRMPEKVTTGKWLSATLEQDGSYGALVGQGIADALELEVGSELILISQGADGSVANDIFIVRGIFGTSRSHDRSRVILPLAAAREFLTLGPRVHEFAILIDDINDARLVAGQLQAALPALSVSPWQVVQETFYKSMEADKKGNQVTLGVILFIVFIGVLNTVLMSVLERTREFGVLKAIGSRPATILTLISLETSLLAFFSLAVGLVVAFPIITWFTNVGIEMPEPIDMGGVSFGFLTGEISARVMLLPMLIVYIYAVLVSIPPGIRAARVSPTQAMRTF
jgi:ABC-type lipoprotein release transport system permease subunit